MRWIIPSGFLVVALLVGCGSGGSSTAGDSGTAVGFKLIDPPVMSNGESADMNGKSFVLVANRQGPSGNVAGYEVVQQSSLLVGTESIASFETKNGMKIGFAYSGTPVYSVDGKISRVLFQGYQGAPTVFQARDINEMLPLLNESTWGAFPPSSAKLATASEMKMPWCAKGLNSKFMNDYKGIVQNEIIYANEFSRTASKLSALDSSAAGGLLPGSTIAVNVVTGDYVNIYATGTLSYTKDGKRWLAFGHPLDQTGRRNLPVSEVFTSSTIDAGAWGTFKDSYPVGPTIGALVYDSYKGVVIDTDKTPETTPVTAKVTMDGRSMTWSHNVARDNGSWLEYYGLNAATWGPLYTLNDISGSFSISGTLTIGVEGKAEEEITIDINQQNDGSIIIIGGNGGSSLWTSLSVLLNNISNAISTRGVPGKSFNSVKMEITISKISN